MREKDPEKGSLSSETSVPIGNGPSRLSRLFRLAPKVIPPPKGSLQDADLIPEATAGWFDLLTFSWITPLLSLGYARPLEATDLYRLQEDRSAAIIAKKITDSFEARRIVADEYNDRLAKGEISPGWRGVWWSLRGNRQEREKQWREVTGKRKPSLVMAMNDSVFWFFWLGGLFKLIADVSQITTPLIVKALIQFATESYTSHRLGNRSPSIGRGIGLSFGLLGLQTIASLGQHHFFYRGTATGVLLRAGLITAIYDKSLKLTTRARGTLTNGKIVNHISTDVSRIDYCCGFFHMAWTGPIQLVICLILLLINIGPSALAGFGLFVVLTPLQTKAISAMFKLRQASMGWTDKRAKTIQELLTGVKIIKFFAWEIPYLNRIYKLRAKELGYIRTLLIYRAGIVAVGMSLPVLSCVIAFIVYGSSHQLNAANIFSSLSLFQMLRMPLMVLPMSISAIVDASNATRRIHDVFEAELLEESQDKDKNLSNALEVDAEFTWDAPPPSTDKKDKDSKQSKEDKSNKTTASPADEAEDNNDEKVFSLPRTILTVPRGKLVAIVGAVGSGKSSLLQGVIGEMRKTSGTVKFGGSVAYCPQTAWIQNATIRENICFGRPFEHEKYWQAIQASCLESDLKLLPSGDMTEVGERGISLSGGQKQRVNICRAIYCDADIQIFDDPLSALDAHVGKTVFEEVFLQNRGGRKTRILVTHAIHFLPRVDYIYTMVDGIIAEQGTYAELLSNGGEFAKFVAEFGSDEGRQETALSEVDANTNDKQTKVSEMAFKKGEDLMQTEERERGGISGDVYKTYFRAAKGYIFMPLVVLFTVLVQGSLVMSSYWLVYWQERKWQQPQGFYMAIYAALGVSLTVFVFCTGIGFSMMSYFGSRTLHEAAINRVMHAPMSFFETTPLGRIMNRFSKDMDNIDNLLGDSARMFTMTISNIFGAIILIGILLPWFLIAVGVVTVIYIWSAVFYSASSRELKRLDSTLRSSLYAHFSESLGGLATIRAYGESERFKRDNVEKVNIENRAYMLTVVNQRWLGIRLDALGILLSFVVAILTVTTRYSISPSQTGVTLSYIISIQQAFGWLVRQFAEVQNDMNSVERIVHYAKNLEQEPAHEVPEKKPPSTWPADGRVELKDVYLKYRPELPNVLQGLTMSVGAGEKIGIVGRTGAGKSSIMTALYRLVELSSGTIMIDGQDVSQMGLRDLRNGLAIIPQDALLFSGTLRTNLDPFEEHDDATLWDALKRSYLVESIKNGANEEGADVNDSASQGRFTLDSAIEDEGANLSLGQRSLVSLARALVKNSKVLILDEATASVDYETDSKIQDTIAAEFADRTILCIAHRLRTIIGYDRICVMDAGTIVEFDTPLRLYDLPNGIFRGMCERSSITPDDLKRAARFNAESKMAS